MSIPMPPRRTTAEVVARAAAKCLRLACARHFPVVSIADVGEVVSGGTPSTSRSDYWNGNIPWVTPKDLGKPRAIEVVFAERTITVLGLESSSARLLPKGTVLLSSRAPIGHLGIAAQPLATNQGFKNIICSNQLNNRYLFHILRGSIEDLVAEGRGNTFLEIPGKVVKAFPIPLPPPSIQEAVATFLDTLYEILAGASLDLPDLPAPLVEQQRLVARIEELAGEIAEARRLRQEAVEEAEALFSNARDTIFSNIETHSSTVSHELGEVARFRTGHAFKSIDYRPSGHFIFRVSNIRADGSIDKTDSVFLADELKSHYEAYQLHAKDILMVVLPGIAWDFSLNNRRV